MLKNGKHRSGAPDPWKKAMRALKRHGLVKSSPSEGTFVARGDETLDCLQRLLFELALARLSGNGAAKLHDSSLCGGAKSAFKPWGAP